ncbi:MAG TPA: hypothetical protein ENG63_07625 [Candidatus Desulfofervidus auxilii]|uniref:Uncharacterized protein n=1 Tax=Desulfofervidus auxilii TaxID=1621989 RepID=A0A7C0YA52_DESA2|nr:MAG: hypothetical protein DRN73_08875 [Candidatus Pacearchaeota archaeon]HDD44711.1 hypothetical protein [Candidatus Desulfofervidus auxilii]
MSVDQHIKEQVELVKKYIEDHFGFHMKDLDRDILNNFFIKIISGSISIKIWVKNFSSNAVLQKGLIEYLREIVSNTNQVLVLGTLGFKSASCAMIRRSLENIIVFLYYKDHPVEFFKKSMPTYRPLKIKDIKDYLQTYPFEMIYNDMFNSNELRSMVKKVISIWDQEYEELSNFIHTTNELYFELINYIDEITPQPDNLEYIRNRIEKMNSIINSFNILFFFNDYKHFSNEEKTLIRLSIENIGLKQKMIEIFGEI